MPNQEVRTNNFSGMVTRKTFASIAFPKTGYAFSRSGSPFDPDAYSHGGISVQEMMIPMLVLRVKSKDETMELLCSLLDPPAEIVEGQEGAFHVRVRRAGNGDGEVKIDVVTICAHEDELLPETTQVLYLAPGQEKMVIFHVKPDIALASNSERTAGEMPWVLTVMAEYEESGRPVRGHLTHEFIVRLNPEQLVRRVPAGLGNILGMAPKTR